MNRHSLTVLFLAVACLAAPLVSGEGVPALAGGRGGRGALRAMSQTLSSAYSTEHLDLRFRPGSRAEANAVRTGAMMERELARICAALEVKNDRRFRVFLFDDIGDLKDLTHTDEFVEGFAMGNTIHVPFENTQTVIHELVHLVARAKIGRAPSAFLTEGLANALLESSRGVQVHAVAKSFRLQRQLPLLSRMVASADFTMLVKKQRRKRESCTTSQNPSHGAMLNPPLPLKPASGGQVLDWGRTRYEDAWRRQDSLVTQRLAGEIGDTLVFTEHEPVFTIGLRAGAEKHLVWDEAHLAREGIEVVKTNRGGDITYHGPGQIVGYPIVSLVPHKDLHAYLRFLEQVLINAIGSLGLAASRRPGLTGIWLGPRKVAALGVAVKRWVAYHGFALNVNAHLPHFAGIVPCGIAANDGTVSSLQAELGRALDLAEVKTVLAREFCTLWPEFLAASPDAEPTPLS